MKRTRVDPREAALKADEAARFSGSLQARTPIEAARGAQVYIITAAQNNTLIHAQLWHNLKAYAKHRGAKLLVSQFTYNKSAYGDRRDLKPDTERAGDYDNLWYAPEIIEYRSNDRLAITDALHFCGELNILPTAERPLSGFENYTGRASAILPHAKQEMVSVASTHATKLLYTTGTVTLRNYLAKKAGQKAEYQHAYGALIVEVDADGDWFVRQIRATEDGAFQDLDAIVSGGRVSHGHRIEGIQPGDIHVAQLDPEVRRVIWGKGGMLDTLKPRFQFAHDVLDFLSRNHHEMKNPHEMFRKHVERREDVEAELHAVARFLADESRRDFCRTVVVDSNHDQALTRWLREADPKTDPVNYRFWLKAQAAVLDAIERGDTEFHLLGQLLHEMGVPHEVTFMLAGDSFVLCPQAGGIECGLHGDRGANGARGSARGFARMGRRTNVGHSHSAGIHGDAFIAGTSSLLRVNYNKGQPSSWSHSAVLTYPNGCRTIITIWRRKWKGARTKRAKTA